MYCCADGHNVLAVKLPSRTSKNHHVHVNLKKYKNKLLNLRGVNGGLSNELFVQPTMDPWTKFDGSFIS